MPKKIPLDIIQGQLPSFVRIIPETYKGKRYSADFIDTEYNVRFSATVHSVIDLQHGCKNRSDSLRSKSLQGICTWKAPTDLEKVKSRLPSFLTIDEASYKGIRYKARFYDKEYKIWFERLVCNVLRGKGFCTERRMKSFLSKIIVSVEQIEERISSIYKGRVQLIRESYRNTRGVATFIVDGIIKRVGISTVLGGFMFLRKELELWKWKVIAKAGFKCELCSSEKNLTAHHTFSKKEYPEKALDVSFGACLCSACHNNFHVVNGYGNNTLEQYQQWLRSVPAYTDTPLST